MEINGKISYAYDWLGRLNIVKSAVVPKLIYKFNETAIKILTSFFQRSEQAVPKLIENCTGTLNSQNNLKKEFEEQNWKAHISKFLNLLLS